MSYDVSIADKSFNYTWNMSKLFYDHIVGGVNSFDGKTGKEVAAVIGEAFEDVGRTMANHWTSEEGNSNFRKHYDAPNNWGSTDGAMVFLGCIMGACIQHPRSKVRVS